MIPKTIHYCWFGGNPLPQSAQRCIESWRKFFPGYEIREWNEDNFDINMMPFTREAYHAGKYAFVSDVARFWILYHEGGVYFDTDVEVIRPFDDIVDQGAFMGFESATAGVNPGLGLGGEKGNPVLRAVLDYYAEQHYCDAEGVPLPGTVVYHTTEVLKGFGLKMDDGNQTLPDMQIYASDYFNPLDDATGILRKTHNTRSIHWYAKTWVDGYGPVRKWTARIFHRAFGTNFAQKIKIALSRS